MHNRAYVLLFLIFFINPSFTKEAVPSGSVVVEAKALPTSLGHHPRKRSKTPEDFKKNVEGKIAKLKARKEKIKELRDKVEPSQQGWFDLKLKCADKWIETLESYESVNTRIDRSFRFANKELSTAQKLTRTKTTSPSKPVYPAKEIEKLEGRLLEVKAHANTLTGDNQKAFNAMVFCGNEYVMTLKSAKESHASVHPLLTQALKYINTAEVFAHTRVSQDKKTPEATSHSH